VAADREAPPTTRKSGRDDSSSSAASDESAPETVRAPPPGLPTLGDVIDKKYRVERLVGSGGMAHVLAARHLELNHSVAIKIIDPSLSGDADAKERFAREARAMASLTSKHAVRVFDVGQLPASAGGLPFMVMELLDGKDLSQVLRERGPLSFDDACAYIDQACDAIEEAHRVGLVHRDLKPQNLFLTNPPSVAAVVPTTTGEISELPSIRVLDFGIARAIGGRMGKLQTITKVGDVVGTLTYMAPEQIKNAKDVNPRADIWALGACLYRLVTNKVPFVANHEAALIEAILVDPPESLRLHRPNIPTVLESVILRCLRKDPAERFASAKDLRNALTEARNQMALIPFSDPAMRVHDGTGAVHKETLRGGSDPKVSVPTPDRIPKLDHTVKIQDGKAEAKAKAALDVTVPIDSKLPPTRPSPKLGETPPPPPPVVVPPPAAAARKKESRTLVFVLIVLVVALLIVVGGLFMMFVLPPG